jgi:D-alanine-D-alanine ligase-like ATP-grasp enzyme
VVKPKIEIIFGGCSEEHPVSVKSAQEVAKHLDLDKYEPLWIGITTSGAWKLCDGPGANWESHGNRPVVLSPDRSVHGLLVLERERYDAKVLIEEAVVGSEVGCAILGERFGLVAGEVDRVALSHGFFRIHQESDPESGSENSTFVMPADIPAEARSLVQETAKAIYRAMGCKGLAWVDTFLTDDGTVVLNEVNTLPGMTSYSRYPRMMAAAGLPLADVIDRLVMLTLYGKKR